VQVSSNIKRQTPPRNAFVEQFVQNVSQLGLNLLGIKNNRDELQLSIYKSSVRLVFAFLDNNASANIDKRSFGAIGELLFFLDQPVIRKFSIHFVSINRR